jgi:alpha-galactosidase
VAAATDVDVARVAVAVRVRAAGGDLAWVLANGYQSWDASGVVPAAGGGARESWWTVCLATADGAGLAAAATDARSCCTQFTVADGELSVVWREAETLASLPTLFAGPAGTRWRSETVLLTAGPDVRAGLASLLDRRVQQAAPAVGWLSWYHLGPWVTRDDVLAHADLLASQPYRELGYRLVQVDDGWQEAYGEWRPNTKFPGGLEALSQELARRGQEPGLWVAPFLVGMAADIALHAPDDWFVADPVGGGRAIDERHRAFGPMYALDASNPAVRDHLRETFAGFVRAGVRYFKIDFLYAGAYAGLAALRAGVQAIREGAGDARLVASGAPLLPLVGLVDGCRVGPDTATPFTDFQTGVSTPTVFGDEVLAVTRNFAARALLHPWFRLDADIALVGGNLTLEQARVLVTIAALSGGPFFASCRPSAWPCFAIPRCWR